ncbi:MAG: hypothetical protein ATN32_00585 [Candidatus Epulonipiscium fishelsonii]|nr:MAG: hypothetical protein ATN32_00585 [Epulopiscium sp. AS2M-Bin002]
MDRNTLVIVANIFATTNLKFKRTPSESISTTPVYFYNIRPNRKAVVSILVKGGVPYARQTRNIYIGNYHGWNIIPEFYVGEFTLSFANEWNVENFYTQVTAHYVY